MELKRINRSLSERATQILTENGGIRYERYRLTWDRAAREATETDRPVQINVELTSRCNLACGMCFKSFPDSSQYRSGELSLAQINAIADEAREISVDSLWLSGGEPLMHPDVKQALRLLGKAAPVDYWMVTNGQLLEKDVARELVASGLTWVSISIDANSTNSYRRIRGASFDRLLRNIDGFLDERERLGSLLPLLRVSFVQQQENRGEARGFFDRWRGVADIVDLQTLSDYRSQETMPELYDVPSFRCVDPYRIVSVIPDGSIVPCCNSFSRIRSPFSIPGNRIMDYWNSEWHHDFARAIRSGIYEGECGLCAKSFERGLSSAAAI